MEAQLKCTCGQVQGQAGPLIRTLNRRTVCMCNDCQAFAHHLGRVDLMLDAQGGTEIVPIHPARIRITQGIDKISCVRLSDDGMRRWYADCCKTPIANTATTNRLPFAGVHRSFLILPEKDALGEVYARVNGKSAEGTLRAILSALRFVAVGFLRGLHQPWPFPNVTPMVGTDAEYETLIEKVKAAVRSREHRKS